MSNGAESTVDHTPFDAQRACVQARFWLSSIKLMMPSQELTQNHIPHQSAYLVPTVNSNLKLMESSVISMNLFTEEPHSIRAVN